MTTKKTISKIRAHKIASYPMWIAILGLLLSLASLSIIIARAMLKGIPANSDSYTTYQGWLGLLWFDNLQTFTILGNILVLIFWLTYLLGYNLSIFKDNRFASYTCSYISMVGIMYWGILLPVSGTDLATLSEISYLTHAATPVLFIAFTIASTFYNKKHLVLINGAKSFRISYWKFIGYGLIFPIIYVSYLIGINFIAIPDWVFNTAAYDNHQNELMSSLAESGYKNYISVYGSITNFNPHCLAKKITELGTITYDPKIGGNWKNLGMVAGIILLVPAIQALFVLFNNKVNKKIYSVVAKPKSKSKSKK